MNALEVLGSFEKAVGLTKETNTGCTLASETRNVALPPKYLGRLRTGVSEVLDAELGKFSESLQGVLLAYGSIKLLQSSGVIMDDSPYIHFDVNLKAVIFNPKIGSLLKCVVKEQASDHVGCLVHDWFNLSLLVTRKELNGQRHLRLEPDYVILVQVERLHSLHGMLAIEARAPDDGSSLILEAVAKDTDTESSVDSMLQPESDDPDGLASSTVTEKKKKRSKVTGEESTSPKKSKKRKRKEMSMDERDSLTTVATGDETTPSNKKKKKPHDCDELPTTEESSHKKKKKKKKHMESEVDPISELAPCDSNGEFTQEMPGEETSHKKKKKKKQATNVADVDSNQPLVTQNGPASQDVVSYQSPPSSPNKKSKKKKLRDTDCEIPLDSVIQPPSSDIFPTSPEEPGHKKAKKHKPRLKQKSATGDEDYTNEVADSLEEQFAAKTEPGTESTTEDNHRSHKKHKRKAEDFCSQDDASVTNGSAKKKKKRKKSDM